eukprot:TRINITY_DN19445_c0_g1_i1.p1 TRINITY_DN19445_c0_g1~~TRINITY_DN19445_c0_g1_i1.p1  ORF type:complete len:104 (-),score=15.90 TRINITY_DN19445_c0_g1_i1:385-696(-)
MQMGKQKEFADRLREYRRSKDTPNLICRICEQIMPLNKYMVTTTVSSRCTQSCVKHEPIARRSSRIATSCYLTVEKTSRKCCRVATDPCKSSFCMLIVFLGRI